MPVLPIPRLRGIVGPASPSTAQEPRVTDDLDLLAVNTIRTLSMDAVQAAQSGHPGTPMALAPLAYTLYTRHLAHNPADPGWPDRDRFVLSAGHASMLLYSVLHLTGYDLTLEDLRNFRQLHSRTPGHPESFVGTPGVETTTGPLGQGLGNAVGMAIAERLLADRFNRDGHNIVDHRTWAIVSDGDMMEGVASEASSLAGHLGLERLIVCYDNNGITIDGPTELSLTGEDVAGRYEAYGWRTLAIEDPNDIAEIDTVLKEAATPDGRPTFVRVRTVIGFGSPNKAGTAAAHGAPLGTDEVAATKQVLGWEPTDAFAVPPQALEHADQRPRGAQLQLEWQRSFEGYRAEFGTLAAEFERLMDGRLPGDWDRDLPTFETGTKQATRKTSGAVINALAPKVPELVGGSADLASSNNTTIRDGGDISRGDYAGRNINYGVREHAMGAIMNGMVLHRGVRPFGGTFMIFTDYLRPSLRLACLSGLPVIYVMTHDSIGLGEDGPTHQPIEHLAALRAIPNLHVLRPADARETVGAWRHAVGRTDGPTLLALTRQDVPVLDRTDAGEVASGAYIVVDADDDEVPDVVLAATGSEVSVAVDAATVLAERDVTARVVSMPSWELFDQQDEDYQDSVLPADVPVLSVEAATTFGWSRWADDHIGIDHFGASAPGGVLFETFGFTAETVAEAALELLED
ncbi:MAG: transketolase [Nitriliruptorales bacterium]|nr:transketolase [Nitriliruptorales bacterium]